MDHDYLVKIEYTATEVMPIKALSKQWAEIVAKEQWEQERSEPIETINVQEK